MNIRNFLGGLSIFTLTSFMKSENVKVQNSPLFYQVNSSTFLAHYTIEGKGVEPSLQQRSFMVETFKVKTSFNEWIDIMRKDNNVVVYEWWVQEAPTAPFDSAVYIKAVLLNKSIPYIMTGFEPRFDYTLKKNM